MSNLRLLVAGSRTFDPLNPDPKKRGPLSRAELWHIFDNLSYSFNESVGIVIEGEAPGVDREARVWAESKQYHVLSFPADWNTYGKKAGYMRNRDMVNECDAAIVVWDGHSVGTAHTMKLLEYSWKPFVVAVRNPIHYGMRVHEE